MRKLRFSSKKITIKSFLSAFLNLTKNLKNLNSQKKINFQALGCFLCLTKLLAKCHLQETRINYKQNHLPLFFVPSIKLRKRVPNDIPFPKRINKTTANKSCFKSKSCFVPLGCRNFLSVLLTGPRSERVSARATDIAFLAVKLNFIAPAALYNEINIKFPFVLRVFLFYFVYVYLLLVPTN